MTSLSTPRSWFARRKFLAALAAGVGLASHRWLRRDEPPPDSLAAVAGRVAAIMAGYPAAQARLSLAASTIGLLTEFVQQLAAAEAGGICALVCLSDADLRNRIRERIERDYRRGNLVAVRGWQLSATEALAVHLSLPFAPRR